MAETDFPGCPECQYVGVVSSEPAAPGFLSRGLEVEMSEHLGYEDGDPAGLELTDIACISGSPESDRRTEDGTRPSNGW